jgi:hypothetical protein
MNKCKRRCSKDPKCYSFHYYLLDPFGITNCWIWTESGYSNNNQSNAYCFVKSGEKIEDNDEPEEGVSKVDKNDLKVTLDENKRIPDKSLEDYDKKYDSMKDGKKKT